MALLSLEELCMSLSLYAIIQIRSHVIVLSFYSTNIFTGKHWGKNILKKHLKSIFRHTSWLKRSWLERTVSFGCGHCHSFFLQLFEDTFYLRQQVSVVFNCIQSWMIHITKGKIIVLNVTASNKYRRPADINNNNYNIYRWHTVCKRQLRNT